MRAALWSLGLLASALQAQTPAPTLRLEDLPRYAPPPQEQGTVVPEQVMRWPTGKALLALTAYDYPLGRILDEAGVDLIHVGDSLGMVVLGMPDTTEVTMADMIRATAAVARGRKRAMISAVSAPST